MRNHKILLIANPNADLGRAWRWTSDLRPVADEFGGADWAGTVYPTHASDLARQAAESGYELVVAVGGDGTIHEVVNGLMQVPAEARPRLGVVPMGSANDFAHSLGMDSRSSYALRQVLTGKPCRIDIGKLQDEMGRTEYWSNTVGIGFDAVVTIRSRAYPYLRGFLVYLLAVFQTILLNHESFSLKVATDRENWEASMVLLTLCNGGQEGGGFQIAPQARLDDGVFHYTGVYKVTRPRMLRLLPEFMKGTQGKFRQVRMGQFLSMEVQADRPLVIHTDGEIFAGFGMDVRHLRAEIIPGAIEAIQPSNL
jgi:YegS/Rv2252/BmrU family lipid kinase